MNQNITQPGMPSLPEQAAQSPQISPQVLTDLPSILRFMQSKPDHAAEEARQRFERAMEGNAPPLPASVIESAMAALDGLVTGRPTAQAPDSTVPAKPGPASRSETAGVQIPMADADPGDATRPVERHRSQQEDDSDPAAPPVDASAASALLAAPLQPALASSAAGNGKKERHPAPTAGGASPSATALESQRVIGHRTQVEWDEAGIGAKDAAARATHVVDESSAVHEAHAVVEARGVGRGQDTASAETHFHGQRPAPPSASPPDTATTSPFGIEALETPPATASAQTPAPASAAAPAPAPAHRSATAEPGLSAHGHRPADVARERSAPDIADAARSAPTGDAPARHRESDAPQGDPSRIAAPVAALLHSTAPAHSPPATPVSTTLAEQVHSLVQQLMTGDVNQGTAVRMVLRDDHLPGVTVSVQQVAGQLQVLFECSVKSSRATVERALPEAARTMARRLGRELTVQIRADGDDAGVAEFELTAQPGDDAA